MQALHDETIHNSVSPLCSRRENGKSRDHPSPSRGYVGIAPIGNNSYASQNT